MGYILWNLSGPFLPSLWSPWGKSFCSTTFSQPCVLSHFGPKFCGISWLWMETSETMSQIKLYRHPSLNQAPTAGQAWGGQGTQPTLCRHSNKAKVPAQGAVEHWEAVTTSPTSLRKHKWLNTTILLWGLRGGAHLSTSGSFSQRVSILPGQGESAREDLAHPQIDSEYHRQILHEMKAPCSSTSETSSILVHRDRITHRYIHVCTYWYTYTHVCIGGHT